MELWNCGIVEFGIYIVEFEGRDFSHKGHKEHKIILATKGTKGTEKIYMGNLEFHNSTISQFHNVYDAVDFG